MDAPLSARKLAITIYEHQLNPTPIKETHTSFDKLAKLLERRTVRNKKLGHRALGPYKLRTARRHNDNVEYFSMAVADVDDGIELKHLRSIIEPYAWIAHSSHSHITAEYDFRHKFRLVFPLSRDVSAAEWPRFWKGFSMFLQGHVDPATKDLSRLFFMPSCAEENLGHAFFEVHQGDMLDPDPIIASVQDTPRLDSSRPKIANAFAGAVEYPESYADVVAEHCAVIRWFKETGAPNEPLWHKCIGVLKHCEDGEEKIHAWSSAYEGYDHGETQRKIDNWTAGPSTCEVIKTLCEGKCDDCTRTCKSPVQLGHIAEAPAPDLSSIKETVKKEEALDKEGLVESIWGENVRKNDRQMQRSLKQDDGSVIWSTFSESIFYPYDLVRNEEGEWEAVIHYYTRYGKRREFQMPTSYLAASDKMASALAAHTVFLVGKQGREFAMTHLKDMILGLQEHRQEIITEEAFGWNKDSNGFIIGTTEITEDTERHVLLSEHVQRGGMAKNYGKAGTRNDWVRLVDEVYNRPGAELYQFAFLVAAASPLIELVGINGFHGIPVAYTGEGGRGKTTACELACSIWGHGESFKQSSNKGGNTIFTLLAKTAIFKNLPWVMDELTGQKTEEISDMLYALSNGQNKGRMGANGSFAGAILHWDLFSFITGNMDVTGLLSNLDRQMAEAVSVRCFEIKVPPDLNETVFKGVNFKTLVDVELRANYGVVGRELIRLYIKHRAKIVALVHKLRQEHQPNTADETRERFYIDLVCFALAAGTVMKKRDMIRFDLDAIKKWAFANIKTLRHARTERQMTSNDLVSDFISSLHGNTVITKGLADLRRGGTPEMPIDMLRGEPLARKVTGEKRFIVAAKAFQLYGKTNNIAPGVVRDALDKAGYILHIAGKSDTAGGFNMRLGQGTTMTTAPARCFELDYAKLHGFEVEHGTGNVVPMHREVAQAEPVKEEEAA